MNDQEPSNVEPNTDNDAARVRVFPPGVPLAVILVGVALNFFWPLDLGIGAQTAIRFGVGGSVILLSVYFLGFRAVAMMRGTGQSENPYQKTTEIIEAGPYRFTRNPMYLQMVTGCLGFSILLANAWILMLTPVGALVLHYLVIMPEEAYLEHKFGQTYRDYQSRVRRWI